MHNSTLFHLILTGADADESESFKKSCNAAFCICKLMKHLIDQNLLCWKTIGLDLILKKCLFFLLLVDSFPLSNQTSTKNQIRSSLSMCISYAISCTRAKRKTDMRLIARCLKGRTSEWMIEAYLSSKYGIENEEKDLDQLFQSYLRTKDQLYQNPSDISWSHSNNFNSNIPNFADSEM